MSCEPFTNSDGLRAGEMSKATRQTPCCGVSGKTSGRWSVLGEIRIVRAGVVPVTAIVCRGGFLNSCVSLETTTVSVPPVHWSRVHEGVAFDHGLTPALVGYRPATTVVIRAGDVTR